MSRKDWPENNWSLKYTAFKGLPCNSWDNLFYPNCSVLYQLLFSTCDFTSISRMQQYYSKYRTAHCLQVYRLHSHHHQLVTDTCHPSISCQSTSQHSSCKTLQTPVLMLYLINYLKLSYRTYQKKHSLKLQLLRWEKSRCWGRAPLGGQWYSCSRCLCFHAENRTILQLFCKALTGREGCPGTQEDTAGWKAKYPL